MIQLGKNALHRISLGQTFAEYDIIRQDPQLFVTTPATLAVERKEDSKCFFIGRRGAGKTATVIHLKRKTKRVVDIKPQVFDLLTLPLDLKEFMDTRQRPFKSLVCAFERALLHELVRLWIKNKQITYDQFDDTLRKDRSIIDGCDFDAGVISLVREIFEAFENKNEKLWLRQIKRSAELTESINNLRTDSACDFTILIDKIDESWDGSEGAIISLMALMHACIHLNSSCPSIKVCLFIRENIFERVRKLDNEFSRLETSIAFLDWSEAKLSEMIERRFVRPFSTKPPLIDVWRIFFNSEQGFDPKSSVFSLTQPRPRDVLMLVSFALESAISANRDKISKEDLIAASERYSVSRLKDLADEYAENFPNIGLIINHFYGLGDKLTLIALEQFLKRMVSNSVIAENCGSWFSGYTTPHTFSELLYKIGFFGIETNGKIQFRSTGHNPNFSPKIEHSSILIIHPTYRNALSLRDILIKDIPDNTIIQTSGILEDLPEGVKIEEYQTQLKSLLEDLRIIRHGHEDAPDFEEIVGKVIKLCFFKYLTNIQPKVRTIDNRTIKDWIASNRASDGFWAMIRDQHGATQVIFECKNYANIGADDFHQASYYLNDTIGRFGIIVFRGDEVTQTHYQHMQRIASNDKKVILLLRQKDLEVFIRQAINGKSKEGHIQEIYDKTVRAIC